MTLQALLVSTDDSAADVLGRILPAFGIALDRSSNPETAIARLEEQKFDTLLLDFDDATTADCVFQEACHLGSGQPPLTVALVADAARVRDILTAGAHFVLRKPLSERAARAVPAARRATELSLCGTATSEHEPAMCAGDRSRGPPVEITEQPHRGRNDQSAYQRRIECDRDGHPETDRLDDHDVGKREAGEDRDHDRGRSSDEPTTPLEAFGDRVRVVLGAPVFLLDTAEEQHLVIH